MSDIAAADPFELPPITAEAGNRTLIIGSRGQYEGKVSAIDYDFIIRWRWTFKISRGGNVYARRGGGRLRSDPTILRPTILLHDVIMDRKIADGECEPRPTPEHTAHHINFDSLDCTRPNLEWQDRSGQQKYKRKHPNRV